ncbi:SH3 domain-containing protein [Luteimonas terrae]|uniref:SH3 domain-containing protein n=1 Tax=Luteimonas terrae TaxID=1530191 RepID=A0ABU1Y116_9GAMM|nr:SH3 domain-containing protein [Luteimonas terrae]MDR7194717.1 hypothetical protein [Luteimonas terrae]
MSDPSTGAARRWRVVAGHTSEYPEPITFPAGAPLAVGERYAGPEGWEDWWFCETPGQKGGWVPAQVIERFPDGSARSREAYTARELDVRIGDVLTGSRALNGWLWACAVGGSESGWVPLANLVALPED